MFHLGEITPLDRSDQAKKAITPVLVDTQITSSQWVSSFYKSREVQHPFLGGEKRISQISEFSAQDNKKPAYSEIEIGPSLDEVAIASSTSSGRKSQLPYICEYLDSGIHGASRDNSSPLTAVSLPNDDLTATMLDEDSLIVKPFENWKAKDKSEAGIGMVIGQDSYYLVPKPEKPEKETVPNDPEKYREEMLCRGYRPLPPSTIIERLKNFLDPIYWDTKTKKESISREKSNEENKKSMDSGYILSIKRAREVANECFGLKIEKLQEEIDEHSNYKESNKYKSIVSNIQLEKQKLNIYNDSVFGEYYESKQKELLNLLKEWRREESTKDYQHLQEQAEILKKVLNSCTDKETDDYKNSNEKLQEINKIMKNYEDISKLYGELSEYKRVDNLVKVLKGYDEEITNIVKTKQAELEELKKEKKACEEFLRNKFAASTDQLYSATPPKGKEPTVKPSAWLKKIPTVRDFSRIAKLLDR